MGCSVPVCCILRKDKSASLFSTSIAVRYAIEHVLRHASISAGRTQEEGRGWTNSGTNHKCSGGAGNALFCPTGSSHQLTDADSHRLLLVQRCPFFPEKTKHPVCRSSQETALPGDCWWKLQCGFHQVVVASRNDRDTIPRLELVNLLASPCLSLDPPQILCNAVTHAGQVKRRDLVADSACSWFTILACFQLALSLCGSCLIPSEVWGQFFMSFCLSHQRCLHRVSCVMHLSSFLVTKWQMTTVMTMCIKPLFCRSVAWFLNEQAIGDSFLPTSYFHCKRKLEKDKASQLGSELLVPQDAGLMAFAAPPAPHRALPTWRRCFPAEG